MVKSPSGVISIRSGRFLLLFDSWDGNIFSYWFTVWQKRLHLDKVTIMSEITLLLDAIARGESRASEDLLPLIYDELRRLAAARMAGEAAGQTTLQPTALVHEAWLRLVNEGGRTWRNRAHFFRAAAQAMRRILVDRARQKLSLSNDCV